MLGKTIAAIGEMPGVQCVLVVRHGRLAAEVYLRGARLLGRRNLKSASKSVLSAVVGIAVDRGELELDAPIERYLTRSRAAKDPEKGGNHGARPPGHALRSAVDQLRRLRSWVASRNWVENALGRPLTDPPGARFSYSTGDTHLLSAV